MIDIQSQPLSSKNINQVGISDLYLPVIINSSQGTVHSNAKFKIAASLRGDQRATHMSRFVEILHEKNWTLDLPSISEMLSITKQRLQSDDAFIEAECMLFLTKTSPVSNIQSLSDYKAKYFAKQISQDQTLGIEVSVPVTSLCPCSKAISEYGAHNQRSIITIKIITSSNILPETIIKIAEKNASSELYSILKREDEKFVTEQAYDNPKFVEDLVRNISDEIERIDNISYYKITSTNYESIHNHQAFAVIEKHY